MNKSLFDTLKKRLQWANGHWVEELLEVLWAHRTTWRHPTGETLFSLAYSMEVVILIEIRTPTLWTTQNPTRNQDIQASLGWVDELREAALIRMETYCHQAMTYYNKRAKPWQLQVRDLVLRKMFENMTDLGLGKLQAD